MKTKLIALFLLTCMLLSYVSCTNAKAPAASAEETLGTTEAPSTEGSTEQTPPEEVDPNVLDKNQTYNVLFVGNSYTHRNDLAGSFFFNICRFAGYKVFVTVCSDSSYYLIDSANPEDPLGEKVDAELKKGTYDFVVLQEQSLCPIQDPGKFYTGVRNLNKKILEGGAQTVLYSTWARQTGNKILTQNSWTNESMTWLLAASYEAIGKEIDAEVAYTGLAFFDVHTNHPEITQLYHEDQSHPGRAGSYLAALTIFAEITGVDPTTLTYNAGFDAETAAILKEAARKAVFETPAIPEQYKTSSEGVGSSQ